MQLQSKRFLPTPRKMPDGKRGLSSPSDKHEKQRKKMLHRTHRTNIQRQVLQTSQFTTPPE